MAAKKPPVIQATPAAVTAVEGADDLQVLNPKQVLIIGGRELTVREYGFVEGLRLRSQIQPLLNDLHALIVDERLGLEPILGVLADHHERVVELMAIAADVDISWIETLGQKDGKALMLAWWNLNGPFWLSEVVDRVVADRVVAARRQHAGVTSTPSSSPPGTEPPSSSGT